MFNEKQPDYRYFKLPNGNADVFIYEYIGEEENTTDDGNTYTEYLYNMNQFCCNQNEITEEMIKENFNKFLNYDTSKEEISISDRLDALESAVVEMAGVIYND